MKPDPHDPIPTPVNGEPIRTITFRVPGSLKGAYVAASRKRRIKLEHWIRELLDAELKRLARDGDYRAR